MNATELDPRGRWFSAKIVFAAEVAGDPDNDHLREASIRVFRAETEEEAAAAAEQIGRAGEHAYLNADGREVTWRFLEVLEVQDLGELELTDGTEVFSQLYLHDEHRAPSTDELDRADVLEMIAEAGELRRVDGFFVTELGEADAAMLVALRFVFDGAQCVMIATEEDEVEIFRDLPERCERAHSVSDLSALAPFGDAIGRTLMWAWRLRNQRGYDDGAQLELRGSSLDDTVTIQVMCLASTLRVSAVTSCRPGSTWCRVAAARPTTVTSAARGFNTDDHVDRLVRRFGDLLRQAWPALDELSAVVAAPGYRQDWLQATWEMLVERSLPPGVFLEPYGEGADCNHRSSRVLDPHASATHRIVAVASNQQMVVDRLTGDELRLGGGLPLEELVAMDGAWFAARPPFDRVLLLDGGRERVVDADAVCFRLRAIPRDGGPL